MFPLLISWASVTVVLLILIAIRRTMTSHETDWLPLSTTTTADIARQETIERKLHRLNPVIHTLEAIDVLLLASLAAVWVYTGVNAVRW
jgi:hypothetical protein